MAASGATGGAVAWYLAGGAPTPILAYQAKGAPSIAVASINLPNPGTNDLIQVGSPTLDARGFTGSDTAYFRTGYTPSFTDQDYTIIMQFVDGGSGFGGGGTDRLYVFSRPFVNTDAVYGNGGAKVVAGAVSAGNMAVSGDTAYFNGSPLSGAIAAGSGLKVEAYVVKVNGVGNNQSGFFVAGALYRPALTGAQVAAVAAAMAAL